MMTHIKLVHVFDRRVQEFGELCSAILAQRSRPIQSRVCFQRVDDFE